MSNSAFWEEITTSYCYQEDFETVYGEVTNYLCSNCGKFAPGHEPYPFCPYCGKKNERKGGSRAKWNLLISRKKA